MQPDPVRELLRTLPGVVYRCAYDAAWTMQLISDEIEVVTGYPASSFIGNRERSFASVIHPDDRDRVAREIGDQLAAADDFACEYRVTRADGSDVWILERGRRVHIADGSPPLLDGLLFDITERKRAQEELRESVAEQAAYRAVAEDRMNVARELHDSVGHALSVVSLHAGVAVSQLPDLPEAARDTIRVIREVVHEALDDMDRMLRELDDVPEGPVASGIAHVPSLVERVRAAGVPVELDISGASIRRPIDVDHAAYRVIQEALTNALKYARNARVTIRVAHLGGSMTVAVHDDGHAEPAGSSAAVIDVRASSGRGLEGLRSRVVELGGELTAGPRREGGFAVEAVLPLDEGARADQASAETTP